MQLTYLTYFLDLLSDPCTVQWGKWQVRGSPNGAGIWNRAVHLFDLLSWPIFLTYFQTHAQYNEANDEYEAHRVAQGYEMGQFIKHTADSADVIIVGGDFNFQPKDLGFKLIKFNGNLLDAWISQVRRGIRMICVSRNWAAGNELDSLIKMQCINIAIVLNNEKKSTCNMAKCFDNLKCMVKHKYTIRIYHACYERKYNNFSHLYWSWYITSIYY